MLRLRRTRFMDLRQQSLVDTAYFAVKTSDKSQRVKKELSVLAKYIRYLFIDRLCASNINIDNLIRSIRRLPFHIKEESSDNENPTFLENEEVNEYVFKYSLKIIKQKYNCITNLADMFAGLKQFQPNLLTRLIDIVYEEIFRGMDCATSKRDYQRMIGLIKFMGELYNYIVLNANNVFDLLYLLIHYGHKKPLDDTSNLNSTSNLASGKI